MKVAYEGGRTLASVSDVSREKKKREAKRGDRKEEKLSLPSPLPLFFLLSSPLSEIASPITAKLACARLSDSKVGTY